MATIAKGMITLSTLNDAYNVSLSPNSCVINADFDGTNPKLDAAYTNITVTRGDTLVAFDIKLYGTSNQSIKYEIIPIGEYTKRIKLIGIPSDILSGFLEFEIKSSEDYSANVTYQFTVVRESTMLDWIQDWENNKTTIGSTYLITPKIFIGKKITTSEDLKVLTGVYIGPDSNDGAGMYGYKQGEEIFHINEHGGSIGGWDIYNGGIQTSDGTLKILSEGSIISSDKDNNVVWGIYKSGEATFAKGNVLFHSDGSAFLKGKIEALSGNIGGWNIDLNTLYSGNMLIDGNYSYIGMGPFSTESYKTGASHIDNVRKLGGVSVFYETTKSYGIEGYMLLGVEESAVKVFGLGTENIIAGWKFDNSALWIGNKVNMLKNYTSESGSITIGTNGLRGHKWYIDSNGDMSFMGGKIKFSSEYDGGEIVGWKLNPNRFSTNQVALLSDGISGLYMTSRNDANFNSLAAESLKDYIISNGGIYLNTSNECTEFSAYDIDGKRLFKLTSNGVSSIAGWKFNNENIYVGTVNDTDFTTDEHSVTISPKGLFGHKWKLLADGSGALAGSKIYWNKNGDITVNAKISADNISSGTISTASIKCEGKWLLNQDGTGYLANQNIKWSANGNVELKNINAISGTIAGFYITSNSLTNEGFDNDACIIFRNDRYNVFGAMGGNTLPVSSGMRAVARFENEDSTNSWYSRNIALILSAKNGTYNHAFMGTGNGMLNGWIGGYRFDRFVLTTANTIYSDYVNLNKNNRWICKSSVGNSGIALPKLLSVQDALGIDSSTPFCVDLYILADIGSSNFFIYGRTDRKDSNNKQPWISDQYPVFVHWDGGRWERQELGRGDCFHVWLTYDPNETQSLDGFSCKYTARMISKQA